MTMWYGYARTLENSVKRKKPREREKGDERSVDVAAGGDRAHSGGARAVPRAPEEGRLASHRNAGIREQFFDLTIHAVRASARA